MSIVETEIGSPGSDDRDARTFDDPTILLENILTGENEGRALDRLVARLGRTSYSIMDLLDDAGRLKEKIAGAGIPLERLVDYWSRLDRTVGDCLALTSLSHEKFLENTLHAFCEFDDQGIIISANARMLERDPHCLGQDLASRFGGMESEVRLACATAPRRLYQLNLQVPGGQWPVLAEFGRIETCARSGGYALLVDRTELEEAEHKALEAAPYGMLKLDARHRVVYASKKALELFEGPAEELLGRDARRFITDEKSLEEVLRQSVKRRRGEGDEYQVLFTRPHSGRRVHLRVMSVPSFDAAGNFSGTITALQPIDHVIGRERIAHLVATEPNYQKLFKQMMLVVKDFVEFDWANLFLFSPRRDYSRFVCRVGRRIDYQSRWFPTLDGYHDWLERPETWMVDLKESIENGPNGAEVLKRPDIQIAIQAGTKALVALPVREGGRIIGGICLLSRKRGIYDAETRKTLERLMLDQALLAVFHAAAGAERDFVGKLVRKVAASENHQHLARTVVRELAKFYKFQSTSIFKVNLLRKRFELLAQAPEGAGAMAPDYAQPLDKGMLGLTYRTGRHHILKDVKDGSKEAMRYVVGAKGMRSGLCIPIRLFKRILWILNVEDRHTEAFTPEEVKTLKRVIDQMQTTLDRMFQNLVLQQVLQVFPQAVVIIGQNGNILRCNEDARRMFQRDSLTEEDKIKMTAFFRGADAAGFSEATVAPTMATVVGEHGKETSVLVSTFTLPEEYDHQVVVLQDVNRLQWKTDFEHLKAALAESVAQVRVPVSLLSSFLQQIGKQVDEPNLRDLAAKAMRQVGRIELTYDRVFASHGGRTLATARKDRINVKRVLDHVLSELPELERQAVKLSAKARRAVVRADTYRVLFALSSMLAYLLRSRADAEPIAVGVRILNGNVDVTMTGAVQSIPLPSRLAALLEATRSEIALGHDGLARVAAECGGTFERVQQKNGRQRLSLRLPAAA
jgi:PAS domain S-box-containing protein